MKIAFCTISCVNYTAYSMTLLDSLSTCQPNEDKYWLVVDSSSGTAEFQTLLGTRSTVVSLADLDIEDAEKMCFRYSVLELSTALKPFLLRWLLSRGYDGVIYLDPDIYVYCPLTEVVSAMRQNSVVLTPHCAYLGTGPQAIEASLMLMRTGAFNLGFIAVSRCSETSVFLDWWCTMCASDCYDEQERGVFVDQKWLDLAIGGLSRVDIIRDPGLNMACWNLHERKLMRQTVNGKYPLVFFHFGGIEVEHADGISRYLPYWRLTDRPDLASLFRDYRDRLRANGYADYYSRPYAFGSYDDGRLIGVLARRLYPAVESMYPHPFTSGVGTYENLLQERHLLERNIKIMKESPRALWGEKAIRRIAKIVLRLGGADSVRSLCQYFSMHSSLRDLGWLLLDRRKEIRPQTKGFLGMKTRREH
jgi:hypothetical protein